MDICAALPLQVLNTLKHLGKCSTDHRLATWVTPVRALLHYICFVFMCVGLLLCPGPVVIGFAMYYFTYDPWIGKLLYLEDFFVMEEYRGKQSNYFPLLLCHSLSSLT